MKKIFLAVFIFAALALLGHRLILNAYDGKDKVDSLLQEASNILKEKKTMEELTQAAKMVEELAGLVGKDASLKTRFRVLLREDPDVYKKKIIIDTLIAIKDPEVVVILMELLDDSNTAVRAVAIDELGMLKVNAALEKLEAVAKSDPNPKLRLLALNSIENIQNSSKPKNA